MAPARILFPFSVIPACLWQESSVFRKNLNLIFSWIPAQKPLTKTFRGRLCGNNITLLNNRPPKCLDYKTPSEVFNSSVALAP